MKTKLLVLFNIVCAFSVNAVLAQTQLEKSIIISKENLKQILADDNSKQTVNVVFDGFETIPIDSSNAKTAFKIVKQIKTEINTPKKKAVVVITNNINDFRDYLNKNEIKYIFANEIKIRTSNIITQVEANRLSATIIDTPPVDFKTEYNNTNTVAAQQFRLYYYETKLSASMGNYTSSLLNGYIDLFQNKIEETKAIINKID